MKFLKTSTASNGKTVVEFTLGKIELKLFYQMAHHYKKAIPNLIGLDSTRNRLMNFEKVISAVMKDVYNEAPGSKKV